ncbi:MAG: patatin-like phospholipase family protein [Tagaea sp.]|nr:patatin-like phospholipase family protein [Tagaea sp.]
MPGENYAIFEGGGAKGIAYTGAYAAATRAGLEFDGVAGASAGAIFASLVAFGYRPDEILDPVNPEANVLATVAGMAPIDIVGGEEKFGRLKKIAAIAPGIAGWGKAIGVFLGWRLSKSYNEEIAAIENDLGLLDTKKLQIALNAAYRRKLAAFHRIAGNAADADRMARSDTLVTFEDLALAAAAPRASGPRFAALKIVITDVTHRAALLCDATRTPKLAVAEAAAASASIPIVFKPARTASEDRKLGLGAVPGLNMTLLSLRKRGQVESSQYVDGGLVSNLPVWAFEEERQISPKATRVYAFSLQDTDLAPEQLAARRRSERKLAPYLTAVARTGVFGGQATLRPLVSRMTTVSVPCDLDVLDFDLDMEMTLAAYGRAYRAVAGFFVRELEIKPTVQRGVLQEFRAAAAKILAAWGGHVDPATLRLAVASPIEPLANLDASVDTGFRALRVEPGATLDLEDQGLGEFIVPNDAGGFGDCFQSRSVVLLSKRNLDDERVSPALGKRFAALNADFLGVPIFDDDDQYASTKPTRWPIAVVGVFFPAGAIDLGRAVTNPGLFAKVFSLCALWREIDREVERQLLARSV